MATANYMFYNALQLKVPLFQLARSFHPAIAGSCMTASGSRQEEERAAIYALDSRLIWLFGMNFALSP